MKKKKDSGKITYLRVNKSHPILKQKFPKGLHPLMKKFWFSRGLDSIGKCQFAILAVVNFKSISKFSKDFEESNANVVGFFRACLDPGRLEGMGTYILPKYRNAGVGSHLWKTGIKYAKPSYCYMVATSRDGVKLGKRLKKKYPEIIWDIERNL